MGSAATSVDSGSWSKCSTETPGVHRFTYDYVLRIDVPKNVFQPVMNTAKAHFAKSGYTPDIPDPNMARVGATLPHSDRWIGVGVQHQASMFISVGSRCVSTSSDPKF